MNEVLAVVVERLSIQWPEGEGISLEILAQRLEAMCADLDRFDEWARLSYLSGELESNGLGAVVAMLDAGDLAPEKAVDEFLYATAEARWEAARAALLGLTDLAYLDRHELVAAFRGLEEARLAETRRLVRVKHLAMLCGKSCRRATYKRTGAGVKTNTPNRESDLPRPEPASPGRPATAYTAGP